MGVQSPFFTFSGYSRLLVPISESGDFQFLFGGYSIIIGTFKILNLAHSAIVLLLSRDGTSDMSIRFGPPDPVEAVFFLSSLTDTKTATKIKMPIPIT